jgi:hypothetical protein
MYIVFSSYLPAISKYELKSSERFLQIDQMRKSIILRISKFDSRTPIRMGEMLRMLLYSSILLRLS